MHAQSEYCFEPYRLAAAYINRSSNVQMGVVKCL